MISYINSENQKSKFIALSSVDYLPENITSFHDFIDSLEPYGKYSIVVDTVVARSLGMPFASGAVVEVDMRSKSHIRALAYGMNEQKIYQLDKSASIWKNWVPVGNPVISNVSNNKTFTLDFPVKQGIDAIAIIFATRATYAYLGMLVRTKNTDGSYSATIKEVFNDTGSTLEASFSDDGKSVTLTFSNTMTTVSVLPNNYNTPDNLN